ncbi:MAG TPA: heavy metal translocating P-type ATPase [Kofleriaceae bacterium]|nr:heavy metal translocating P-type ATPase [Kofleriaceae bacterium]
MTWFQALRDAAAEALRDIDQIADRVAAGFHDKVLPVVQDIAERVDGMFDETKQDTHNSLRQTLADFDGRYQQFMIRRIDPLFGSTRSAQLTELGGLDISPQEQILNRRIAYAALAFVATVVGGALFPPSLLVTAPVSFLLVLPVYGMAYRSVLQQRRVTYHVVSAISITAIWLGGLQTPLLAALVFFYLGEKLLLVTEDRSRKGLISVFAKQPRTVWRRRDGREEEVAFGEVLPGDVIVVSAGGVMPVDGTVIEGRASIDQHMLTGEAQPIEKAPDDIVYASTVVLAGKLHVRVDKAGTETVAAKIGELLNRTASYQLALQSRGSKIAHDAALPTLILGGVALTTLGPQSALAMINSSFGVSIRISAPITMLNLLNIASANAILLKDGRSLELLSDVDTVLFDKTGTLTISQPHVVAIHRSGAFDEDRLLRFAAAAEHRQTHPIALAILTEAQERGLALPDISNANYEVGYGIKVELAGQTIQVGSDRFMQLSEIAIPDRILEQRNVSHARGHSFIMVAVDGVLAGAIELQPTLRPEIEKVIQTLRGRGLKMMIISGDQEEPTRRLAEQLGFDRYFANILPEGKANLVEQLQAEGRSVCFVGDGINDSIALRKANVSVSLRGATTVATDVAQVVLMQESLRQLPLLFELSDYMARSLQMGYVAGMVPGLINVAGVFLLGWTYYQSLALSVLSATIALGIGIYPVRKYKQSLEQSQALALPNHAQPNAWR